MSKTVPHLEDLDMSGQFKDRSEYETRLVNLQVQMLRVQQAYYHEHRRAIIVFEGWDAAGKGGIIRRLTERLDPRGCKVWPIAAPKPEEQGRHYLYRFWTRLPEPGTVAVFDRSWYGRVLVERVEGLASEQEWRRAYNEIVEFERMLTDDGVRLIKVFLHITPDEQLKRFAERLTNPYKRWKLTEEDIRNREKWPQYQDAINEMFKRTSTSNAPWVALPANFKWHVRAKALEAITAHLSEGVSLAPPAIDPALQIAALERLGLPIKGLIGTPPHATKKTKKKKN